MYLPFHTQLKKTKKWAVTGAAVVDVKPAVEGVALILARVHVQELVMAHVKAAAEEAVLIVVLARVVVHLTKF